MLTLITEHAPTVIALTETKISSDIEDKEVIHGYTIYRKDRSANGGGVLLAVRDDSDIRVL